jgi:UDP-3-O-[3-hydroxymyristoyl] glucosamine N-acyltransferase
MPAVSRVRRQLTVAEIAVLTDSRLSTDAGARHCIGDIASLAEAGKADIAFIEDEKDLPALTSTRAGACFVTPRFAAAAPPGVAVLVNREPYHAFVAVARTLFPDALRPRSLFETSGRAAGVQVHASARIETGVTIDPFAMIGPRAEVGTGTLIAAGAAIGPDVCIGRECTVGAGATIEHALIGDRVLIGAGARIGQDGLNERLGSERVPRIPHIRRVIIQDDVAIGANVAIDRGSIQDTVIGEGTKIDNLVQIAHNVRIGRHCLIAVQAGIAGGTTLEDFATIGCRAAPPRGDGQ